jgi:hypothetical protein
MQDVVGEFDELVLPDKRLTQRVRRFVEAAWKAPSASFPEMLEDAAQLEAGYRLLSNPRVSFDALHASHVARSVARTSQVQEIVVVHDTTQIEAPYASAAEVGYLNTGRTGYRAHVSLAVGWEPNRPARPLGVLSVQANFQGEPAAYGAKKRKSAKGGWATARSKDKAFLKWERGIEASAEALPEDSQVIHVGDREADSYPLFCKVMQLGQGCVIRLRNDRRARIHDDENEEDWSSLAEIATTMEGSFERSVPLSRRGSKVLPVRRKTHPPREERCASLRYAAAEVEIRKPHYQPAVLPASLQLWFVRVWEPSPPAGETPIEWLLLTTEPCTTRAEIMRVVELYRARWVIEDFFKALKTGCAIEKRQLESRHALLNTLALFLPIAVHLLWLRTCARDTPDAPATDAFTPLQLTVLRHRSHRKIPDNPTVMQAMWSLAGLGGHIANNGWPGWQVLGRAFVKLIDAVATWKIAIPVARDTM